MGQIQPYVDPTGTLSPTEINEKTISAVMKEMNNGVDVTTIQRRAITPGQIRVISYEPGPIKLHAGSTLASNGYASVVINFDNNGLTAPAGQTFLPFWYADLFVDPADTSSVDAMYSGGNIYPDGANMTSALQNLTFSWYLRNSTPGTNEDVVSYVLQIRNSDSNAHAYWVSVQLLMPADANLNPGSTASYLP